jgi:hypothetical protein
MGGTLGWEVPATLAFDPGQKNGGIALRVGSRFVNGGCLTPHDGEVHVAHTREEREVAVWSPPGERVIIRKANAGHLIGWYTRRLIAAGEWLLDTYAYLLPDGAYCAVEWNVGRNGQPDAITRAVAAGLFGAFDGEYVRSQWAGSLHQPARGGTGDPYAYYPPELVGPNPEFAEPGSANQPVRRLPNEHYAKRNGAYVHVRRQDDIQAAYDIAGYLHRRKDGRRTAA